MRISWKKRLGVCSGLALLCLTVVAGALALPAGAATGNLIARVIRNNGSGGTAELADFQYQVDGGAVTNWPVTGIVTIPLDDSVTHDLVPVPFAGFDVTTSGCTGITIDPVTAAICVVTFTFTEPVTTTTTTTTTTTVPHTTTTPPVGQVTVHGSHTDSNNCISHLIPLLQADAKLRIGVTLATDASPQPHRGDPISLASTTVGLNIPATLIQAGVDLDLIKNGDQVPSTVTVGVAGVNTTQKTHTYVINATAVIHTQAVPKSTKYPKGQKALPLNVTLPLPDTNWTPVNGTDDVSFNETSLKIVSHLFLPAIGSIQANFTCTPSTPASFVALGATGAPATTVPGGGPTTPTSAGTGGPNDTSGVGAAAELPRTGSNPWPLLVLGAICIDLGLLAVAGAKRGRRRLLNR